MNLEKDFTKENYLQEVDKLLSFISELDDLFNNDFISLEDYFKVKNRILDEIICLRNFEKEQIEKK